MQPAPPLVRRTARLLYIEILFSAVAGAIVGFDGAYLLRLGGNSLHVSLLTAIPALAAMLFSVPAGHFLQTRRHPRRWIILGLGTLWSGFALFGLVPWITPPGMSGPTLAILILTISSVLAQAFQVGIYPMLAELLPEQQRMHAFAVRSIVSACVIAVVTFLTGQWLNRVVFPINYQVAYAVLGLFGWIGVGLLAYASHGVPAPARATVVASAQPRSGRLWPSDLWQQRDFLRITVNTLLHSLGLWLATPLLVVYYVRALAADDAWLGLNGGLTGICTILGLFFWRRVAEHWREPRTLRVNVISVWLLPLVVALVPNLTVALVISAINGFFTAGITVSHMLVVLKTLPEERQPQFMALYNTVLNIGGFLAPILAVPLSDWLGLQTTLMVCGVLGILGALAHWTWRVPSATPPPPAVAAPEPGV